MGYVYRPHTMSVGLLFPKDALMRFTDPEGVERACVVMFVQRDFGYTWAREHYFAWIGEKYPSGSLQIPSVRTHRMWLDVKDRYYPPKPKNGGQFHPMGDCFFLYIYFDDSCSTESQVSFPSATLWRPPWTCVPTRKYVQ
jgi:hypothetical protein